METADVRRMDFCNFRIEKACRPIQNLHAFVTSHTEVTGGYFEWKDCIESCVNGLQADSKPSRPLCFTEAVIGSLVTLEKPLLLDQKPAGLFRL